MDNNEARYSMDTTPTGIPIVTFYITDVNEARLSLQEANDHFNDGSCAIEFDYNDWNDPVVSKAGIIFMTPVEFVSATDFNYICSGDAIKNLCDKVNDLEYCGVGKLRHNVSYSQQFNRRLLEKVNTVLDYSIRDVTSIRSLAHNASRELGLPYENPPVTLTSIVDTSNYNIPLFLSPDAYLYRYVMKQFGYNNMLMTNNEFINKENLGLSLLFDSVIPSKIHDNINFMTASNNYRALASMNSNISFINDNLIKGTGITTISPLHKHGCLTDKFIEERGMELFQMVVYEDSWYVVIEDADQVDLLYEIDQENSPIPDYALFTKNVSQLYRKALVMSGCGGFDKTKWADMLKHSARASH